MQFLQVKSKKNFKSSDLEQCILLQEFADVSP